jgi:hypothetical protein
MLRELVGRLNVVKSDTTTSARNSKGTVTTFNELKPSSLYEKGNVSFKSQSEAGKGHIRSQAVSQQYMGFDLHEP